MIIKQDERFQGAADAQLDIWCAEDAGGHADDAAKLLRRLVGRLSDDYGLSRATVSALVARRAMEAYGRGLFIRELRQGATKVRHEWVAE